MTNDLRDDIETIMRGIREFRINMARMFAGIFADKKVTLSQYTLLAVLNEKGESTMSELSESLGLTMGAGTSMVDRLIDAGYVTRRRSARDRRVVKVQLTDTGREKLQSLVEDGASIMTVALSDVSAEERKTFIKVLYELLRRGEREVASRSHRSSGEASS